MSDCNCSIGDKDIGKKILGIFLCTKTNQCFITHIVEKTLAVLFWISIIGAVVFAFEMASGFGFSKNFGFGTFLGVLIISLVYVLIIFYFIFLLKEIRDKLKHEGECGCESETELTKAKKVVAKSGTVASVKKRGRRPGSKNKTKTA
ncbi:MAG: hypothetical protein LBS26_05765 [Campylobacteraceae bacterium]|jgi:preprotein translocase subunit YajC|nr:hypothetical protein [Campylobacteraceae bacterium]